MSYLKMLKGKKIEFAEFTLSSTEGINATEENTGIIELYLLLKFEEYSLSIFNDFLLLENIESANELTGDTLIEVDEKENYINFLFESGKILQVNMTEEDYIGPEAMHLAGKDGLNVVWN
jgi:hypothetical protein